MRTQGIHVQSLSSASRWALVFSWGHLLTRPALLQREREPCGKDVRPTRHFVSGGIQLRQAGTPSFTEALSERVSFLPGVQVTREEAWHLRIGAEPAFYAPSPHGLPSSPPLLCRAWRAEASPMTRMLSSCPGALCLCSCPAAWTQSQGGSADSTPAAAPAPTSIYWVLAVCQAHLKPFTCMI